MGLWRCKVRSRDLETGKDYWTMVGLGYRLPGGGLALP